MTRSLLIGVVVVAALSCFSGKKGKGKRMNSMKLIGAIKKIDCRIRDNLESYDDQ